MSIEKQCILPVIQAIIMYCSRRRDGKVSREPPNRPLLIEYVTVVKIRVDLHNTYMIIRVHQIG